VGARVVIVNRPLVILKAGSTFADIAERYPEFSEAVMRRYVEKQREELASQGEDADRICRDVQPSPAGQVLRRFGRTGTGASFMTYLPSLIIV
jgi:hypothetical protein